MFPCRHWLCDTEQYQRYVGVAIVCFGILGPLFGLLSSSRQALVMLLRLELLWTGGGGASVAHPPSPRSG